jgi:endo-1,4-beta-xylanase
MRTRILVATGVMLAAVGIFGVHTTTGLSRSPALTQSAVLEHGDENLITDGQWQYLPGATVADDGLHIGDLGLKIVQQDGSGGQPNPPINLYGTHLSTKGDFALTATAQNIAGTASVRFYDKPPLIADEYRVEPASVEVAVSAGKLVVNIWDGKNEDIATMATPTITKTIAATITDQANISVAHRGSTLEISLDGAVLASIKDRNVFKSGNVWVGASDDGGSYTLSSLKAAPINGGTVNRLDGATINVTSETDNSLQNMAAALRPGFVLGTAVALGPITSDSQYARLALNGNFSSVTTENALKWQNVEPKPGVFNYKDGDAIVALAKRHNMTVHGHTLVFSEANPSWVSSLPTDTPEQKDYVKQVMVDHITNVVSHFKGRISSWDVVNEPFADYDAFTTEQPYRDNVWFRAMGKDYITIAFNAAHAADPDAKLYVNEYGLEAKGERFTTFNNEITSLTKAGVPIDGVGMQSHIYDADDDKATPNETSANIDTLANPDGAGVVTRISELDVTDDAGTRFQAAQAVAVLRMCIGNKNCVGLTSWGFTDRYDTFDDDGQVGYGHDLLWDEDMRPTAGFNAVIDFLKSPAATTNVAVPTSKHATRRH